MSIFLTLKNPSSSENPPLKIESRAIKLNLFDENDLPNYPIYEIFTEKFPDFICQICLYFVVDPVECLTCNSIFCKKCLYEYTSYSKHCPNRCELNYRPVNRILKNIINSVKVPCIYYHKGCKEILNYETYYSHVKICPFNPYMCNQCYLVDVKENVENHCKICNKMKILKDFSNNNKRRFFCRFCNLEIINLEEKQYWYDEYKMNKYVRKFLIHEYLCNEQIILCNFCEKNFRLYDYMRHVENNTCLINQLNNKINYLIHKVDYYESNIKNKKILDDEEEIKKYREVSQIKKIEIPFSKRYGITQSLISNQIKQEEKNEIKKEEKRIKKEKFIKENSFLDSITKNVIKEVHLKSKKFIDKNHELSSLTLYKSNINSESDSNTINDYNIITSLKSSVKLSKDTITSKNLELANNSEYNIENQISELLPKNKNPKRNTSNYSTSITHILITELNQKKDIILITESNHYFLYSKDFSNLIKKGNPTSTSITCLIELIIPKKGYCIALGTYSSNVQILSPYENKILYTLNHTKKRILSLCYHNSSNTLIISSAKENAFYLWKYISSKDIFELKSTIRDNDFIWSILLIDFDINKTNDNNLNYIVTGGGDKSINLWEFFPEENAALKRLNIKGHHESVTIIKWLKIRYNCCIISGAFDGCVKIHKIKRSFNDEFGEVNLIYKELITIYNKDYEIINLEVFYKFNENENYEEDEEEVDLIINLGRSKGYSIHKILFNFNS